VKYCFNVYFCKNKKNGVMLVLEDYYQQEDVLFIAKDLLGKWLFTQFDGQLCGGMITETEAYMGVTDRASHAFGGRRTARNEMMYAAGGVIYVYQCYGIHALLNIVTHKAGTPEAILIRGIFPTHGEELMLRRLGKIQISSKLTDGPGKLSKALGIKKIHNGLSLQSNQIWIEGRGEAIPETQIRTTPRIGVDYAGEDALLPYRFITSVSPSEYIAAKSTPKHL
jgi:DNA-3-methyladenine glycosylase